MDGMVYQDEETGVQQAKVDRPISDAKERRMKSKERRRSISRYALALRRFDELQLI